MEVEQELSLKIYFDKSITVTDLVSILYDINLILKNTLEIYEFEHKKKIINKNIEVKKVENGSIHLVLNLVLNLNFVDISLLSIIGFTIDYIRDAISNPNVHEKMMDSHLDRLQELYSNIQEDISDESEEILEEIKEKHKFLNIIASFKSHLFELAERCKKKFYKILLSASNVGEVSVDKETYDSLIKRMEERPHERYITICGYIQKINIENKPYIVEIVVHKKIKFYLSFDSDDVFNKLKEHFSTTKEKKVMLKINLTKPSENYKKANKGKIVEVLGECQ